MRAAGPCGCLLAALLLAWPRPGSPGAGRAPAGFSRLQRRSLAVDFIVPALFRSHARDLLRLGGRGFGAGCSLALDCPALLQAGGAWLAPGPRGPEPPLPRVLKAAPARKLRRAKQLVLEVGEGPLRRGCAWEPGQPAAGAAAGPLRFDLSDPFAWWLRAGEGRLRIRLMPDRRAAARGREGRLAAAIRAAQPRLLFHIAAAATGLNTLESPTNSPLPSDHSAWNLTWVMKDSSPFSRHRGQHIFDCNFESSCELEYSPPLKDKESNNQAWQRVSAEEISQLNLLGVPERDYSEDSSRGVQKH